MAATSLVIVRAGDTSLHSRWIAEPHPEWDLAVSYFGDETERTFGEAAFASCCKGGKWDGIHAFLREHPHVLEHYRYFWLPDDDILTDAGTITRMFRDMDRHSLELAQPALTFDSYFSTPITLSNPLFAVRYTTMVEIMAPVLDVALLKKMLPHFAETQSGFGLDYVWHRLTSDPRRKAAILDDVSMTHTRPIGSALAINMQRGGRDAEQERERTTAKWNVSEYHAVAFSGRLRDGRMLSTQAGCALYQVLGLAKQFHRTRWDGRVHRSTLWKYYRLVRYGLSQVRYTPDLSQLDPL